MGNKTLEMYLQELDNEKRKIAGLYGDKGATSTTSTTVGTPKTTAANPTTTATINTPTPWIWTYGRPYVNPSAWFWSYGRPYYIGNFNLPSK